MNWFYEFLPAELQTRIFAHVLGLTLGDRNDMISLWQYRHAPQRTRAECLALELKRLAGLRASAGEPGGDAGGGVEVYDWQAEVAAMKRESLLRYQGRTINAARARARPRGE